MIIKGKAHWAKIFKLVPNFGKDGFEWTMDLAIDKDTVAALKAEGLLNRIKDKDDARGKFVVFKRKQFNSKDEPNEEIRVVDKAQKPWDRKVKIGNGSDVEVKFRVWEYAPKQRTMQIEAVRVINLVPYEVQDFPEYEEEGPAYGLETPDFEKDFGLDEDVV